GSTCSYTATATYTYTTSTPADERTAIARVTSGRIFYAFQNVSGCLCMSIMPKSGTNLYNAWQVTSYNTPSTNKIGIATAGGDGNHFTISVGTKKQLYLYLTCGCTSSTVTMGFFNATSTDGTTWSSEVSLF